MSKQDEHKMIWESIDDIMTRLINDVEYNIDEKYKDDTLKLSLQLKSKECYSSTQLCYENVSTAQWRLIHAILENDIGLRTKKLV